MASILSVNFPPDRYGDNAVFPIRLMVAVDPQKIPIVSDRTIKMMTMGAFICFFMMSQQRQLFENIVVFVNWIFLPLLWGGVCCFFYVGVCCFFCRYLLSFFVGICHLFYVGVCGFFCGGVSGFFYVGVCGFFMHHFFVRRLPACSVMNSCWKSPRNSVFAFLFALQKAIKKPRNCSANCNLTLLQIAVNQFPYEILIFFNK